jgi:predicted cobalt transporter CbtA
MMRSLLIRGMLVGVLAGVLAFAFARTFGQPDVDRAIAFEDSMHKAAVPADSAAATGASMAMDHQNAGDEVPLVSRPVQAGVGLFTGVVVYGAAFGGIFAVVFGFAWGRLGRLSPRAVAALIAAVGFAAIVLVPQLKYPANPPSVGHAETIVFRTQLFMAMLFVSITAAAIATVIRARFVSVLGGWNATLAAGGIFVVAVAVAMLLPAIDEVPNGFPAALLWQFRIASFGAQGVIWLTLGLVFGALTERSLARA